MIIKAQNTDSKDAASYLFYFVRKLTLIKIKSKFIYSKDAAYVGMFERLEEQLN